MSATSVLIVDDEEPLARILGYGSAAQAPEWFTTAPAKAIAGTLEKLSLKVSDIDLFEVNEAFSVVSVANERKLSLDRSKVNVHGGAVALGVRPPAPRPSNPRRCALVATAILLIGLLGLGCRTPVEQIDVQGVEQIVRVEDRVEISRAELARRTIFPSVSSASPSCITSCSDA